MDGEIESKVSKRLSGGGIVTTGGGAGGRDVSDLTTVVALFVSYVQYSFRESLQFGQPPEGTLGRCVLPDHSSDC
jgi:hypothetical protein